ncbi:MAG: hypothetical protein PHP17_02720 [Candidatus Omnitrophica bacterium]|nr:hypothetical protein [Candidatus Omnitrophota bacterium]
MKVMSAVFLCLVLFGFSNASAQQIPPMPTKVEFQKIDTNKDGFVSSEELQAYQAKAFENLDKNKNGIVDKSELNEDKPKLFANADKNNDAQISQKEACDQFNEYFNSMDRDKDRRVTQSEFEEYWPINLRL